MTSLEYLFKDLFVVADPVNNVLRVVVGKPESGQAVIYSICSPTTDNSDNVLRINPIGQPVQLCAFSQVIFAMLFMNL